MNECVQCGARGLRSGQVEHSVKIAEHTFLTVVPATVCPGCGESYVDAHVLELVDLSVAKELAHAGEVSGESFRFLRRALGLTAVVLGRELGVAPETISRWERGERNVDTLAWVTLSSLVADRLENRTATLDRIHAVQNPSRLKKTVRLDLPWDRKLAG